MANQVIAEILRQGRGKPRRRVLAALVTGRVESNFRNLPGGDADSQGWRQERASLYRNPRNLRASVRRFYQEAAQHDRGQGAGRLAADVQRPAAQYRGRYAQHMSEARQILAGRGGTSLGSTSGGGGGSRARAQLSPGQAVNVAELLSSRGGGPAESRPSITPPAAPSFSTQVTTPAGYHPIEAVAAQPRTDYGSAISKIASAAAAGPGVQIQRSRTRGGGGGRVGARVGSGGRANVSASGVAKFEGKQVAAWIKPALVYARRRGWKGQVNSGYRSFAEQQRIYQSGVRPAAKPGTSRHEGTEFPRGAVDVSGAEQLAQILRRSPWRKRLQYAGAKDPVHFSHPYGGHY